MMVAWVVPDCIPIFSLFNKTVRYTMVCRCQTNKQNYNHNV